MYLELVFPSSRKIVESYRAQYRRINEILLKNPRVLDLAHADFCTYLSESEQGRESRYTSEEILRALAVMYIEQDAYRDVVVRIEDSEFLRTFVGLGMYKTMMDFTFMSKAHAALSPETWRAMNTALGHYARGANQISADDLRVDTTAYETHIHYPTDSSMLWDSFRVLARTLKRMQQENPALGLTHRYHVSKVKKLAHFISRNAASKVKGKQREVKRTYRMLLARVRWIVSVSKQVRAVLTPGAIDEFELEHYEPLVERIIDQTQRRIFDGENVPPDEKLYSLFEEHTELLIRGKAGKRLEFGHMVLVAQTREKFISHYRPLAKLEPDQDLLPETLDAHRALFGHQPRLLAADKGFYESVKQLTTLETKIETVSICKKGRRTAIEQARESTKTFKDGQRFRAGVEGSISVLKRAFKLNRCLFKGFKNFSASVGCAVFCYNLVLLARL
jgi:IS5 family transposase